MPSQRKTKVRRKPYIFVVLIVALLSTSKKTECKEITWEIINRFRVIKGEAEEQRYADELERFTCRSQGPGKIYDSKSRTCHGSRWGLGERYPSFTKEPFSTFWNENKKTYDSGFAAEPRKWNIRLSVNMQKKLARGAKCTWDIDGKKLGASECTDVTAIAAYGQTATSHVQFANGSNTSFSTLLTPHDILIASIGDSFASGEGNPEVGRTEILNPDGSRIRTPAGWWDRRCHRSLLSGPALASFEAAKRNKHRSVTFLSYACSGATVMSGLLGPYTGIELYEQLVATRRSHNLPDEWLPGQDSSGELLPQVSALAMNLCETTQDRCTRTKRRPDYLIISIGGNDIEFGNLLREFSLNTTTDNERQEIISRLTENRKRLQENLSTLAHRVLEELNPRETIITEYPDPTMKVTNMNGVERLDYCSDNTPTSTFTFVPRIATPFGYGLSKTESKFAQNHVLSKLNEDLRIFAKQHNWIYASGITSATKGKGFCANPRNFHNYMDSYRRQGTVEKVVIGEFKFGGETSGAMHPNFFGHLRYRDAILKLLD